MSRVRRPACQCAADSSTGSLKFIVDAQLPKRLAAWLLAQGHDCVHTRIAFAESDARFPDSPDCSRNDRCLITKDGDFQMSFELGRGPRRLLLVSTGNLDNDRLIALFETHHDRVIGGLNSTPSLK